MNRTFLIILLGFLSVLAGGCPSGPLGPGSFSWTMVGNAPWHERHFLHGTVFNGQMWVIGGLYNQNSSSATLFYGDVWSSANGTTWTERLTDTQSDAYFGRRYGHRVLSFNNQMYLVGGRSGALRRNDVWTTTQAQNGTVWANILTDAGTPAANQFSRRMDFGAEVFNGNMFVIGGYDGAPRNDVWSSPDGITWTNILATTNSPGANQFEPRWGHSTAVMNGLLWVIGGGNSTHSIYPGSAGYTDVWNSPDGITWTKVFDSAMDNVPPTPYDDTFGALYYHQTVSLDPVTGPIWLTGGWKAVSWGPINQTGNTVDGVDWTYGSVPFDPRFYHLSLAFSGSVWLMGGMGRDIGPDHTFFRDVWRSP